jgi:predicted acetyltransferase
VEIRNITKEERTNFSKICRYAFEPQKNNYDELKWPEEDVPNEWIYGAFENGSMMSTTLLLPFELKIRDKWFNMSGVAAVATKPEFRNRGTIKKIFQHVYKEMYESGVPISVIYPFKYSYYEQFGYRLADEKILYQFEIESIKTKKVNNRFFKEVETITEDIKNVYDKAIKNYNYIAKGSDLRWKQREKNYFKYVCYDDRQKPVGYILIHFLKDPTPSYEKMLRDYYNTIVIMEMFWLDKITKQAILNFLWTHRDHRKYIATNRPVNELFIEMLDNPVILCRSIRSNSMVRVIDVKNVLETLEYPLTDFDVTVRVLDKQCSWNDKNFRLSSASHVVKIEEISDKDSDLEIEIGYLSQLIVGFRTIEELLELEQMKINKKGITILKRLFPSCTNFLRDFF